MCLLAAPKPPPAFCARKTVVTIARTISVSTLFPVRLEFWLDTTAMRDLTRRIAAGFYRMGIWIGTEKTPVERRAQIGKNRRLSALCKAPISFCAP